VVTLSVLPHSDKDRKIRTSQIIKPNFLLWDKAPELKGVLSRTAGFDAKMHSATAFESVDIEVGGIFDGRVVG
jgi:hypothetical protein